MFKPVLKEPNKKEARPNWSEMPADVLEKIEKITGKIIKAEIAWGGFSPSACFLVENEIGRGFFIKASHPAQTSHGAKALRQEISIYKNLDIIKTTSPKFIEHIISNDDDAWNLAIWEKINGSSLKICDETQVKKIMQLLFNMHKNISKADLNYLKNNEKSPFAEELLTGKKGWKKFLKFDDSNRQEKFTSLFIDKNKAKNWLNKNLSKLVFYQDIAKVIKENYSLIHLDLRSDNIMLTDNGDVKIIDWTNAEYAPILFDLIYLSIDIEAEFGIKAKEVLKIYEDIANIKFKEQDILSVLACLTGYLSDNIWKEIPEKLPRLRWIQKICFISGINWFAEELNLEKIGIMKE